MSLEIEKMRAMFTKATNNPNIEVKTRKKTVYERKMQRSENKKSEYQKYLDDMHLGRNKATSLDQELYALKEMFKSLKSNEKGMGRSDFMEILGILGYDTSDTQTVFRQLDVDDNGTVDVVELVRYLLRAFPLKETREDLIQAFLVFDPHDSGFISIVEMRRILSHLGDVFADEEINTFIQQADMDNDGQINYVVFIEAMLYKPFPKPTNV